MKKILFCRFALKEKSKLFKNFVVSVLLVTTALANASPSKVQSQILLKINENSIIEIFNLIEDQSDYNFAYDESQIKDIIIKDLKVKSSDINFILDKLKSKTPLTFKIINNSITVKRIDLNSNTINTQGSIDLIQQVEINGTVSDPYGNPLPGASVRLKGNESKGTETDFDGNFSLLIEGNENILLISFMGYLTQEIPINGQTNFQIILNEDSQSLDEIIVVGYGTQKKATLTGAVSAISSDLVDVAPVASMSNALIGKLPGLIATQPSGLPGSDQSNLSIRGFGNALVIVDGVESDMNNIDSGSIESISILKDAAAAIYGARAGNGVVLITTKRGNINKPTITLDISTTLQGIVDMPKPTSAGQYAELESETWIQSGKPPVLAPYSEEEIQKFYDGTDPLYPNTDWFDYLFRDWAPQNNYKLSVRGGSEEIKYYAFLGYLKQETMTKRNGGAYERYNLQSNIDAKISDKLSIQIDLTAISEKGDFPWRGYEGPQTIWNDYWSTLPIYPSTLPDPNKISFADGDGTGGAHITSNKDIAGYQDSRSQQYKGAISLKYSLDELVDGLSTKAFVNIIQDYSNIKKFTKPVDTYTYDPESGIYTLANSLGSTASLSETRLQGRVITGQFSFNYNHTFNEDHHVNALALYELTDYANNFLTTSRIDFLTPSIEELFAGSTEGVINDGTSTEMGRTSYVGRLNYSYKDKYLVDLIFRADASAKFSEENRWGYFPGISLGWMLTEESFMSNIESLDNLKLRLSYGQSGNDGVGNFQYLSGYRLAHLYIRNNQVLQGINSTGLANPDLTWEEISIYNAGIDFQFFGKKLYGSGDVFYRIREGIPATRITSLPTSFGAELPPENLNSLNNRGFELIIGTKGTNNNDFTWDINGQVSWSRSKWDHFEEPEFEDEDQARINKRSGRWTDVQFGFVSDGLFTSQDEIDNLNFDQDQLGNTSLRPGDIRYVDSNEDGILDWKDVEEIGKGTIPQWVVGLNTSFTYKNFDFYALLQGSFGYYTNVDLRTGKNYVEAYYNLRWTEENNNPNALVPRLGGAATNNLFSDYRLKEAGYVRLKALSIGYTIPKKVTEKANIENLRFYFSGTNLITLNKLDDYGIDPETPNGKTGLYYPQQKTFTFGINVSF